MGLSASQARLLNLTARMHDIEYKAQNLEAQKLQMANESDTVYAQYEEALNATKVQMKYIADDGSVGYQDINFSDLADGQYTLKICNVETGTWTDGVDPRDLTAIRNASGCNALQNDNATLSNMLKEGLIVFEKVAKDENGLDINDADGNPVIEETNVATNTDFQEVSDETALKKAEAKYEADMRKINNKDKKFDTELAALESERNAIKTEIDTLKSVAKDNVDRTYKLFS